VTRTLILTRHAKSAWDDPTLDDFDRTLNRRGRKSAVAIGRWLLGEGYLPDLVLVSGAKRTVETWGRMASLFPETAVMVSAPALYHASADMILSTIRTQTVQTLMVICHNPGIADFANLLADTPAAHPRFQDYPTGATTVFNIEAESWQELDWGAGQLANFVVPRELMGV
jgi:phosphohistidine phosphatase